MKIYKIRKFAKHTTTIIMEFWKNLVKWTLDQSIRSNRRLPRELLIISGFFCQLKMGLFGCIIPSRNLDSHSKKDSWIEEGPPFPALTSAQTPWSPVQTYGLKSKVKYNPFFIIFPKHAHKAVRVGVWKESTILPESTLIQ